MKIIYVITRADAVGGASIHVRDLAAAMISRGHQAEVLLGGEGPVAEQLSAAGVPFASLRELRRAIHPLRDLRAVEEIAKELRRRKPDLVSTHTAKAGFVGRAACARVGIPAVYTPHGLAVGNRISPRLGGLFAWAERRAARWCGAIICVSEAERLLAIEKLIAPPEKLVVVHNGMPDVPLELRAHPSVHPPRICSVARFEAPKDHQTLLRALASLVRYEWQLDLVGEGPLEPEIKQLAKSLDIARRVKFHGYLRDPAAVLASSQIFVLSSRSEALPRSILEAMRAGLPVVASAVGGVPEAVIEKRTGRLFRPGNVNELGFSLEKLIQSASERQLLGEGGRHLYEARFGFERMVDSTFAVYATVLDSTGIRQRNV